jgi:hypothetical protein
MFDDDPDWIPDEWNERIVDKLHDILYPLNYEMSGDRNELEAELKRRLGEEFYMDRMIVRFVNDGMAAYM